MSNTTHSMRAVVFKSPGRVVVEDRPMPRIQDPRDAIVKVKAAGLCGSDLHWFRGNQNMKVPGDFIPGHEVVGEVYEVGSAVKKFQTGESVVDPNADTSLLHPPPALPERLLVLMGDIFPTGYFCASRFLKPMTPAEAKETVVAVVGCGPVGICAIAAALTWCDTVYAIGMIPERIAEAEKIGAKPLRLDQNPEQAIKDATDGRGADLVLEVVGGPKPFQLCLDLIRPFGTISSVGVQATDLTLHGPTLHAKNVKVEWGRCPVYGIFDEALECLVKVQEKVSFLCDKEMKLEEAVEAYDLFDNRKVHKIILIP
ncbi:hypothetical protein FOYG_16672 [Fusarium oxysporum NRRL 32931]|uniref:Enoyl reductase (ER) domain-containing protein n=1 Tax=Fusarium oxysporum NRRL 32931 TaxID=660029 RepID=W9HIF0_FUSOX|nr:hypothetical protein FOYG_16672 [Fusarium oxysporum NRRL 32931]